MRADGGPSRGTRMAQVFCICRGPDDGSLMIECNYCTEWFHTRCIGMEDEQLNGLGEYKCVACQSRPATPPAAAAAAVKKRAASDEASPKKRKRSLKEEKPDLMQVMRAKVAAGLANLQPLFPGYAGFPALCAGVEAALFEAYPEVHDYKSKYLSLLFNLKDPKNARLRLQLTDGSLGPADLVRLSPAEMANEDLSEMIQRVREESVSGAVLEDAVSQSFVKKTHKGEEIMRGGLGSAGDVPAPPLLALAAAGRPPMPFRPPAGPPAAPEPIPEPPAGAADWEGMVLLQDVASFWAAASALRRMPGEVTEQLPANLHITGRIPPAKVLGYLESVRSTPSRAIYVLEGSADAVVEPALAGTRADPAGLLAYLTGNDRWAVVAVNRDGLLRDMYMAPAASARTHEPAIRRITGLDALPGGAAFFAFLVTSLR